MKSWNCGKSNKFNYEGEYDKPLGKETWTMKSIN
jgi:hypothetical protein